MKSSIFSSNKFHITLIILSMTHMLITSQYTYNLQTTSTCIEFNATYNVCSKWSQSGSIQSVSTGSCFIGQTLVYEKEKGFIQMKDIKIGDKIKSLNKQGNEQWTIIQGWIHKNQQKKEEFMKLILENNQWIGVTEKHNIAVQATINSDKNQQKYKYIFPVDIKSQTHHKIFPCLQPINSIQIFISTGLYAPLTSASSYLIYTQNHTPIFVHDYSHLRNPQNYQLLGRIIFTAFKFLNGGQHKLNQEGMNVAAEWMMKWIGIWVL